jgi:protein DJ-1
VSLHRVNTLDLHLITELSVIVYDTLVRAGITATSVFVAPNSSPSTDASVATCSRGVKIVPDALLGDSSAFGPDKYDLVVVPGGAKGAETITQNKDVQRLIKSYFNEGKLVGMICAGEQSASV